MAPAVKLVIILKQHCPDFVTRFGLGTTINRLGLGTKITRLGLGITMIWLRTLFTHRCIYTTHAKGKHAMDLAALGHNVHQLTHSFLRVIPLP